ncbi:MAG: Ig-like domain-containing protein [Candidatus Poribacteria bacterium]|nr:Ig-like domain-containing protein [Candidatus Poribacteria bacterium]
MKNTSLNPKIVSLILTVALVGMSFVFIGCGFFDDNSQPEIETITNQTLYVDEETEMKLNIIDEDIDDTHIISVSSDNTTIATALVSDTTLTIVGIAAGIATITVSVMDDSTQDNAAAIPVVFQVTVNEPIDKGVCIVGMILKPGESCRYISDPFAEADIVFSVLGDGRSCRKRENLKLCVESDIEQDDFFGTNFSAKKAPDGSWTIESVPWFYIRQMLGILNPSAK